jgi:hypothetical protein
MRQIHRKLVMENIIDVENECHEEVISSSVNESLIWTDKLVKTLNAANPPPRQEERK